MWHVMFVVSDDCLLHNPFFALNCMFHLPVQKKNKQPATQKRQRKPARCGDKPAGEGSVGRFGEEGVRDGDRSHLRVALLNDQV